MLRKSQWLLLITSINIIYSSELDAPSNVSEPAPTTANVTDTTITTSKDDDWKPDNSSVLIDEKLLDIELSTLNKYRRNGIDPDYSPRWDDRKYMMDYPNNQQHQYEDEFFPPQSQSYRDKSRYNGKAAYPVRVQGCSQHSRDVSRDNTNTRNAGSGILQGWLGAAHPSNSKGADDKRLDMSPFYVTTATAKTPTNYRTQENKQFEYDSGSGKSKYGSSGYKVRGSASKNFYNYQNGGNDYDERERNEQPWRSGGKNNRVVYYEYNLDDGKKSDSPYYQQGGQDQNYPSMGFDPQCELEEEDRRPYSRNQERNRYNNFAPQSRLSNSFSQESNERRYPSYYPGDLYQNRNIERNDDRSVVYEYPSPFQIPVSDRLQPPTITSPGMHFRQDLTSIRHDKGDIRQVPFGGHRFNY